MNFDYPTQWVNCNWMNNWIIPSRAFQLLTVQISQIEKTKTTPKVDLFNKQHDDTRRRLSVTLWNARCHQRWTFSINCTLQQFHNGLSQNLGMTRATIFWHVRTNVISCWCRMLQWNYNIVGHIVAFSHDLELFYRLVRRLSRGTNWFCVAYC
jgi:hypothetical protein